MTNFLIDCLINLLSSQINIKINRMKKWIKKDIEGKNDGRCNI